MVSNKKILKEVQSRTGLPMEQIELFQQNLFNSLYDILSDPSSVQGGEILINHFGVFTLNLEKIKTIIDRTESEEIRNRLTEIYGKHNSEFAKQKHEDQ